MNRVDTAHPPLLVVDDVVLGQLPDGTIDHVAATKLLQLMHLKPESIATIEILKSASAIARFGPGAHEGAVLITTVGSDLRLRETKP